MNLHNKEIYLDRSFFTLAMYIQYYEDGQTKKIPVPRNIDVSPQREREQQENYIAHFIKSNQVNKVYTNNEMDVPFIEAIIKRLESEYNYNTKVEVEVL